MRRPFVRYVGNQPRIARWHFSGLQEALPELRAVGIFDRSVPQPLAHSVPTRSLGYPDFPHYYWEQNEIENYICSEQTLLAWAAAFVDLEELLPDSDGLAPAVSRLKREDCIEAMRTAIAKISAALDELGQGSPWGSELKVSDHFLVPVFQRYFQILDVPNLMPKSKFYRLAAYVPKEEIDPEVERKLDAIVGVALNEER